MYSALFLEIPSVDHSLKLLQVALQIEYQQLVEVCMNYLAAVPWSQDDERRIREFASSLHYPSGYAVDLSARFGLPLSSTERHSNLLDLMQEVVSSYYLACSCTNDHASHSQNLFSSSFCQIMARSSQTLAERILEFLNDRVKRSIFYTEDYSKRDPFLLDRDALCNVRWSLETRTAKEVVEYIVEQSTLNMTLRKKRFVPWQKEWMDIILCIVKDVIEGRLMLETSTRYKLIMKYAWILALGSEVGRGEEIAQILTTFALIFPYEQQKEIFLYLELKDHMDSRRELNEIWIRTLQERVASLEQQRSTANSSQSSASPPNPTTQSAFFSADNIILSAGRIGESGGGLNAEGGWAMPDIAVTIRKLGGETQSGVIREVMLDGSCRVVLRSVVDGDSDSWPSRHGADSSLKNGIIKVVSGKNRGCTGNLLCIDQADGIVMLDDIPHEIRVLGMNSLGKIAI